MAYAKKYFYDNNQSPEGTTGLCRIMAGIILNEYGSPSLKASAKWY